MNNVYREEKKYVITKDTFYRLRHYIAQVMHRDYHSEKNHYRYRKGDGYTIRSLYFDSLDDRDFHEKLDGIELRRKCRLRTYMHDPNFCLLELKKKQGHIQKKSSYRLTREQGERLIRGDYQLLLELNHPFLLECYYMMMQHVYRPRSVVTYERDAFVAKENKIRVTFDQAIRGTESNFDIFSERLQENEFMDANHVVLEVKYNGFLLQYIKDLLDEVEKEQLSVSKYCLSRKISKHYVL
ncbi:polyphosphate polymerase domain-containing protein [Ornithinibacillus californiensis]|uniref:polyphosphate polymerase domain-containing protein n=1 Tax=Ornithinibacillus californiensis TaxID=161536 RepID=UPI00064D87AE|nr:polyphosphate polymerase domain-containing protein [Ornithinibacillus californiensis]